MLYGIVGKDLSDQAIRQRFNPGDERSDIIALRFPGECGLLKQHWEYPRNIAKRGIHAVASIDMHRLLQIPAMEDVGLLEGGFQERRHRGI